MFNKKTDADERLVALALSLAATLHLFGLVSQYNGFHIELSKSRRMLSFRQVYHTAPAASDLGKRRQSMQDLRSTQY